MVIIQPLGAGVSHAYILPSVTDQLQAAGKRVLQRKLLMQQQKLFIRVVS